MTNKKIIFCGLLLVVGVLFFSLADSAGATCICRDSDWDYSGITLEVNCESMCQTWGGVAQWAPPTQDCRTQGCPTGQSCNSDGGIWTCSGTQDCRTNGCPTGQTCRSDGGIWTCAAGSSGAGDCLATGCPSGQSCENFDGAYVCLGSGDYNNTIPGGDYGNTLPGVQIGLPGSGGGSVSLPNFVGANSISELILKISKFLMALAIPFAIAMLVWSGFLFATAQGSEDKIKAAKKNFTYTIIGIAVIMASEALIYYIQEVLGGTGGGLFSNMVQNIKDLLEQIIALLFTLVTVYFIWGVVTYVRAAGDEAAIKQGKKHMLWGIIGMAIMAAAWPIVALIKDFFE